MTFPAPYDLWFPDAAFDGSYGFTLDTLRAVAPVPPTPGFADRWRGWRESARSTDAVPRVLSSSDRGGRRVSLIELSGVDGVRLRAWYVEPLAEAPRVGVVHSHGYGGRERVDLSRVPRDAAAIFPVARGLGALNVDVGAPEEREAHVLTGLSDPEVYVIGLCARDLWLAGDALRELAGDLPLYFVGESFGGGLGALAVPWDDRYVGATLVVPTFGQYDERLAAPCLGSGEHQRRHVKRHPEAREQLRPFDASTSALFFRIPVRVEAALWDQYVPPPGQFSIANAVPADLLELEVLPAGHAEYPGLGRVIIDARRAGREHLERSLTLASEPRG
ncbi:acetylxylan esterase [Microbacterium esteraromaticum]|uniref:acetylxylan esterase n=1 Tax=Microbacterium esteraromaticum TaxID=57043 RepID=UPI001959E52B|nr:acetylxylan esterase [Microbacterium esteraromaticum]MBM7465719.1 cephalosporin-C deacetylase [Microbacterium esteraromaticum]